MYIYIYIYINDINSLTLLFVFMFVDLLTHLSMQAPIGQFVCPHISEAVLFTNIIMRILHTLQSTTLCYVTLRYVTVQYSTVQYSAGQCSACMHTYIRTCLHT